jgi:hypothetical protein
MKVVMNIIKICAVLSALIFINVQCGDSSTTSKFNTPALSYPSNGAVAVPTRPTLSWVAVSEATSYQVQISTSSTFSTSVYNDSTLHTNTVALTSALNSSSTYYWRVRAINGTGYTSWSTVWNLTTRLFTGPLELIYPNSANTVLHVGDNVTIIWSIHDQSQISGVEVRYSLDGGATFPSTQVLTTNGSPSYPDTTVTWVVASNQVSNNFVIKAFEYNNQATIFDKSSVFTVAQ